MANWFPPKFVPKFPYGLRDMPCDIRQKPLRLQWWLLGENGLEDLRQSPAQEHDNQRSELVDMPNLDKSCESAEAEHPPLDHAFLRGQCTFSNDQPPIPKAPWLDIIHPGRGVRGVWGVSQPRRCILEHSYFPEQMVTSRLRKQGAQKVQ